MSSDNVSTLSMGGRRLSNYDGCSCTSSQRNEGGGISSGNENTRRRRMVVGEGGEMGGGRIGTEQVRLYKLESWFMHDFIFIIFLLIHRQLVLFILHFKKHVLEGTDYEDWSVLNDNKLFTILLQNASVLEDLGLGTPPSYPYINDFSSDLLAATFCLEALPPSQPRLATEVAHGYTVAGRGTRGEGDSTARSSLIAKGGRYCTSASLASSAVDQHSHDSGPLQSKTETNLPPSSSCHYRDYDGNNDAVVGMSKLFTDDDLSWLDTINEDASPPICELSVPLTVLPIPRHAAPNNRRGISSRMRSSVFSFNSDPMTFMQPSCTQSSCSTAAPPVMSSASRPGPCSVPTNVMPQRAPTTGSVVVRGKSQTLEGVMLSTIEDNLQMSCQADSSDRPMPDFASDQINDLQTTAMQGRKKTRSVSNSVCVQDHLRTSSHPAAHVDKGNGEEQDDSLQRCVLWQATRGRRDEQMSVDGLIINHNGCTSPDIYEQSTEDIPPTEDMPSQCDYSLKPVALSRDVRQRNNSAAAFATTVGTLPLSSALGSFVSQCHPQSPVDRANVVASAEPDRRAQSCSGEHNTQLSGRKSAATTVGHNKHISTGVDAEGASQVSRLTIAEHSTEANRDGRGDHESDTATQDHSALSDRFLTDASQRPPHHESHLLPDGRRISSLAPPPAPAVVLDESTEPRYSAFLSPDHPPPPAVLLPHQRNQCKGCAMMLDSSWLCTSRYCHYTGWYFCSNCHSQDKDVVPAKVIFNSDFAEYKVCRSAHLFLRRTFALPVIRISRDVPPYSPLIRNSVLQLFHHLRFLLIQLIALMTNLRCPLLQQMERHLTIVEPHIRDGCTRYSMKDLMLITTLQTATNLHRKGADNTRLQAAVQDSRRDSRKTCETSGAAQQGIVRWKDRTGSMMMRLPCDDILANDTMLSHSICDLKRPIEQQLPYATNLVASSSATSSSSPGFPPQPQTSSPLRRHDTNVGNLSRTQISPAAKLGFDHIVPAVAHVIKHFIPYGTTPVHTAGQASNGSESSSLAPSPSSSHQICTPRVTTDSPISLVPLWPELLTASKSSGTRWRRNTLHRLHSLCSSYLYHIPSCPTCSVVGGLCAVCNDPKPIWPLGEAADDFFRCPQCETIQHRSCAERSAQCPICFGRTTPSFL
eukprot:GHVQ01025032.1.p1 GENE.GHVQ01025032.1~~GHVQ01025032.1.p1  ORF type:complete len:1150 (+),score=138.19 GHVQ01025032.1:1499-4948(+)